MTHWTSADLTAYNNRCRIAKTEELSKSDSKHRVDKEDATYELEKDLMFDCNIYFNRLKDMGRILDFVHINDSRGEKPDIPDYLILLPHNKIIFIECKSAKGKLSKGQKEWIKRAAGMDIEIHVCKSMESVIEVVSPLTKEDL